MRKQRFWFLIGAMLLCMALFAGCSGQNSEKQSLTLEMLQADPKLTAYLDAVPHYSATELAKLSEDELIQQGILFATSGFVAQYLPDIGKQLKSQGILTEADIDAAVSYLLGEKRELNHHAYDKRSEKIAKHEDGLYYPYEREVSDRKYKLSHMQVSKDTISIQYAVLDMARLPENIEKSNEELGKLEGGKLFDALVEVCNKDLEIKAQAYGEYEIVLENKNKTEGYYLVTAFRWVGDRMYFSGIRTGSNWDRLNQAVGQLGKTAGQLRATGQPQDLSHIWYGPAEERLSYKYLYEEEFPVSGFHYYFNGEFLQNSSACIVVGAPVGQFFPSAKPGKELDIQAVKDQWGQPSHWVESKEEGGPFYLYLFDDIQVHLYTNRDGTALLPQRDILVFRQGESFQPWMAYGEAEEINPPEKLDVAEAERLKNFIGCLGKAEQELEEIEGLSIMQRSPEGTCISLSLPAEVIFFTEEQKQITEGEFRELMEVAFRFCQIEQKNGYRLQFEEVSVWVESDAFGTIRPENQITATLNAEI